MARTITIPHSDKIGSMLLIAFSVAVFVLSAGLPEARTEGDPGSAFYPRLIAGSIMILALVQFVKRVVSGTEVRHEVQVGMVVRVSFVIGFFAAYVLLLPLFGFLAGSFLFLLVLLRYSGESNPAVLVGVSIGLPLVLFYVFSGFFNIPLPESEVLPISRLLPSLSLASRLAFPVSALDSGPGSIIAARVPRSASLETVIRSTLDAVIWISLGVTGDA